MMGSNSWYSPWPKVAFVFDSNQGLWVKSIIEEAVKITEAAAGIIEEVMGERHLVPWSMVKALVATEVVVKW